MTVPALFLASILAFKVCPSVVVKYNVVPVGVASPPPFISMSPVPISSLPLTVLRLILPVCPLRDSTPAAISISPVPTRDCPLTVFNSSEVSHGTSEILGLNRYFPSASLLRSTLKYLSCTML